MTATNRELSIMARMEPTSVEYQIHHVVKVFQIKNASQAYQNIPFFLVSPRYCWMNKSGTKATNISGARPCSGHEAASSNPLSSDNKSMCFLFIPVE